MTEAEQKLWFHLRRKQLSGVQFYRQRPIGQYIVDFYAPRIKLVIEVDGSQHHEREGQAEDLVRDGFLTDQGLQILRFDNLQVLRETHAVVMSIDDAIGRRLNGT